MNGEMIKQFMVGLGFGVNEGELAKFTKALASATLKVTALYTSTQVMAAGIFKTISSVSEGFEKMGYEFRIIAPAVSKELMLRRELLKAYAAAGINISKVVKESVEFNHSLTKTKYILDAIHKSVGAKFLPMLTKQMDIFRGKIYANLPKIQSLLERFVKFVFKAFEATTILGSRIWSMLGRAWEFFRKLDEATDGWSTKIFILIAAWKTLNLAFLASPLGLLLMGLLAILALYDDFKTFQEGGESLIDWGNDTVKMITGIIAVVSAFAAVIGTVVLALKAWAIGQALVNAAMMLNPVGLVIAGIVTLIGLITALAAKFGYLKGASEWFTGLGSKVMGVFGGAEAAPNVSGAMQPSPLMPTNAGTNQKINQETNINIQGSPDANATGKAVAGEQGKVNFDLTRNLKSATQ